MPSAKVTTNKEGTTLRGSLKCSQSMALRESFQEMCFFLVEGVIGIDSGINGGGSELAGVVGVVVDDGVVVRLLELGGRVALLAPSLEGDGFDHRLHAMVAPGL